MQYWWAYYIYKINIKQTLIINTNLLLVYDI